MKYCPNCKSKLRDDAVFCVNCGINTNEYTPTPTSVEEFSDITAKLMDLANELKEKYVGGMTAMDVNVTIAKEKIISETGELKAQLDAERQKSSMLMRELEDAKRAVANLNTEISALKTENEALKQNAVQSSNPAPSEPTNNFVGETQILSSDEQNNEPYRQEEASTQTPEQPRFCPNCGNPITSEMLFCNECGYRLK
ncbi:MAG: zinc ribbon domain-containing protein [Clostridia bacterium]|nr:zinc ribbon domain-containing protein [Clostridia bacterium]